MDDIGFFFSDKNLDPLAMPDIKEGFSAVNIILSYLVLENRQILTVFSEYIRHSLYIHNESESAQSIKLGSNIYNAPNLNLIEIVPQINFFCADN